MEAVAMANIEHSASTKRTLHSEQPERHKTFGQQHPAPLNIDNIDDERFAATLDRAPFGGGAIMRLEHSAGVLTRHDVEQSCSDLLALLQVAGSSMLQQPIVDSTVVTGDLVVVDCSQPFRLSTERSSCYLAVALPAECTSQAFGLVGGGGMHVSGRIGSCAIAASLIRTIFENVEALSKEDPNSMLELLSAVLERSVLACVGATGSTSNPRSYHLRRIKRYACEHLRNPALKPETIAEAVGVSRRYLDDLFQNEGTSIARYIWAGRLQGCKRDLEDPRLAGRNITEIAFSWGFNSASHFSRAFSERYGVCPSQARGRNRKKQHKEEPLCAAM